MWSSRFWATRFWGSRFWTESGANPPPGGDDCYTAFTGIITDETTSRNGIITDDAAFNGIIEDTQAFNGVITEVIEWTSQVNVTQATLVGGIITLTVNGEPAGQAMNGLIDNSITAMNGLINEDGIALNSKLCVC